LFLFCFLFAFAFGVEADAVLVGADTTTAMNESEETAGNSKNGGKQQREWRENFWAGTATLNTAAASRQSEGDIDVYLFH
jgi:hypothetical protein